MEKFRELNRNVGLCFQKINYSKYFYSSKEEKSAACRKERDELTEYVNSDSFKFKGIVEEKFEKVQGKLDFSF